MSYTGVANRLADTDDLAHTAAAMAGRCAATGLDASGYRGLVGCAVALGRMPQRAGARWGGDRDFMTAVADLHTELAGRLTQVRQASADAAQALEEARRVAPGVPWAELPESVRYRISDCYGALQIREQTTARVGHASARLAAVPDEMGETYAAVYRLVAAGRMMPINGRWLTRAGD